MRWAVCAEVGRELRWIVCCNRMEWGFSSYMANSPVYWFDSEGDALRFIVNQFGTLNAHNYRPITEEDLRVKQVLSEL